MFVEVMRSRHVIGTCFRLHVSGGPFRGVGDRRRLGPVGVIPDGALAKQHGLRLAAVLTGGTADAIIGHGAGCATATAC